MNARVRRWSCFSLLLILLVPGCDRQAATPDGTGRTVVAQPAPDPLADAPEDFGELLTWAEARLQQIPDAVPLPASPNLSRDVWPVIRLADPTGFRRATRESPWQPRELEPTALAEIGPFKASDGPSRTFNLQRAPAATADGREGVRLIMGGFRLERSEVGIIDLELLIPFGRKCTLKWGKAGEIPILISSNDKPFRVRLLTDGLAEWRGPLKSIQLITDGVENEGDVRGIEIRQIRFLSQAHAYPFGVERKRVRVGVALKDAIYTHSPASVTFQNLEPPAGAVLVASLAAEGSGDPVTFRVHVRRDGQQETVLEETITPGEPWRDVRVALDNEAGLTDVILETACAQPETVAFWGNPEIFRPDPDAPLVVLYLVDTLCSEHLDLYGFGRETAPFIAALGKKGAWFQQMMSNSPRTVESIPDMMLSMTTERHGVHHNLTPAPIQLVTLADALHAAGFATSAYVTNVYAGPRANMDQGFTTFVDKIAYHWTEDRAFADRTIPLEETLAWIDANADRPRFLYIHTAEPHAPYTPPEGFRGQFDNSYDGPFDGTYGNRTANKPHFHQARRKRDLQHIVALYNEEIRYADAQIGRFLAGLRERDLVERLNIFITADHGEEFYQHGAFEHGLNMHNEQTRVPLVVAGPLIPQQGKLDTPAALVDIMPTVLDLFGLQVPYPLEGRSLVPALRARRGGPAADQPAPEAEDWSGRLIVGSNHNYRGRANHVEFYATRGATWKLIHGARPIPIQPGGPTARFGLFRIDSDPHERQNVIAEHPDIAREMIGELLAWRQGQRPYNVDETAGAAVQDPDQIRQLEAMGYLGDQQEEP